VAELAAASGHRSLVHRPGQDHRRSGATNRTGPARPPRPACAPRRSAGFSDAQLAQLLRMSEQQVRTLRWDLCVRPVYYMVDTCAAEVRGPHALPVLQLRRVHRGPGRRPTPKVIILGSGPNRIGQGIEFDYACVHACFAGRHGRLRDRDGQLQPGDCLHRLRHLGPALLRAADPWRMSSRSWRAEAGDRRRGRRHRLARRADAARAGAGARSRGRCRFSAPLAQGDSSPGRGSGRVQRRACGRRAARSQARHRVLGSRRGGNRGRNRISGAGAAVLRARRCAAWRSSTTR